MNENLDDGKIILKKKIFVKENQSIESVYKVLFSMVEPNAIKLAINLIIKK